MPYFASAPLRRKCLWFASAATAGVLMADWYRFQFDGPDNSLLWCHVVHPRWSQQYQYGYSAHARGVYTRFFGEPPSAVAHAEEKEWGPWKHCPFRNGGRGCGGDDAMLPQDLRTRFMRYASPDPATGELVLGLTDFVRCMLLLTPPEDASKATRFRGPPFMRARFEAEQAKKRKASEEAGGASSASSDAAAEKALPPHVQRRLKGIFDAVDLDRSGRIDYAEFVVLFTMLSTRRRTFKAAFELLDDDDNMAVNEHEFTRLVNTLMVDPSVQLVYDGTASIPRADKHKSVSGSDVSPDAARTKNRRIRRTSRDDRFTHRIPSSLVMHLVTSPIPQHLEPPPGSTHHLKAKKNYVHNLETQLVKDNQAGLVSFDTFWYRMDFLRWELRAVEFGTFDRKNTGFISLHEFRRILSYDARHRHATASRALDADGATTSGSGPNGASNRGGWGCTKARDATVDKSATVPAPPNEDEIITQRSAGGDGFGFWNFGRRYASYEAYKKEKGNHGDVVSPLRDGAWDAMIGNIAEDTPIISWQFYQTVFDIIRESDRTLPALHVALRSLPPTLPTDLVAGAIPDGETTARSEAVQHLVTLKTEATTASEKKAIVKSQAEFVRPTALTWHQFGRVLDAVDGIPKLSEQDQRLFFALFDADRSGTITPDEFAQLCELKRSFFATSLPRFTEPRRNTVQQFVFCMQQLE